MGVVKLLRLSKRSTSPFVDAIAYRSLIGSQRYLLHTCPDLSFSVRVLELFYVGHRDDHMAALKHLLRYVAVTKGFGLKYKRAKGAFCLMGYNDIDLAGDMDDRRSTTGVLFFLGKYGVLAITEAEGRD
jgi:hypothetical protein